MKILIIVLVVVLILITYSEIEDAKQWAKFRVEHKCKVTAHMGGDYFNTVDGAGNIGVGRTPDKKGWTCDDGVTYFKSR